MDRYTVISADCHAGADLLDYRPFLEARYHDAFDDWAASFVSPYGDLVQPDANRNWDSTRRMRELEADGVVGEVVFPNTIPPFYPRGSLVAVAPSPDDFELRLAGLRAHNRWLADWCAEFPGRRAGIGQILLNDVDEAVRDVHWIADHGLRGGVLLPGVPPDAPIPPLHARLYDPVWRACEERGVNVNAHGGSSSPDYGEHPASLSMWIVETAWFSHRPLWTFILAGVFDRFPALRLVLAEQGSAWIRDALDVMDNFYAQIAQGNVGVMRFVDPQLLERMPSEYWQTQLHGRGLLPPPRGLRPPRPHRCRPHHVGRRLSPPGGHDAVLARGHPHDLRRAARGRGAGDARGRTPPRSTASTSRSSPRWPNGSGRRVDDVMEGLDVVPDGAASMAFREHAPANV